MQTTLCIISVDVPVQEKQKERHGNDIQRQAGPSPGRARDREQAAGGFDDFLSKVVSLRAFVNYSSYIFNILNCCFLKE